MTVSVCPLLSPAVILAPSSSAPAYKHKRGDSFSLSPSLAVTGNYCRRIRHAPNAINPLPKSTIEVGSGTAVVVANVAVIDSIVFVWVPEVVSLEPNTSFT